MGGVSSESRENKHKDTIRIAEEIITDGDRHSFFSYGGRVLVFDCSTVRLVHSISLWDIDRDAPPAQWTAKKRIQYVYVIIILVKTGET